MTHYTGQAMEMTFGETPIVGLREVNIPEDHPTHDTTHAMDEDGTAIGGGITFRFDCSLTLVDDTNGTAFGALYPGAEATLIFYPEGNEAGKPVFTGTAIIKRRERPVSYNTATVVTATFDITETWDEATVGAGS